MAALRKMITSFTSNSNSSLLPPTLFISCRGIASKLFVGGLSFNTSNKGLSEAFCQYGQVVEGDLGFSPNHAKSEIIMDRVSEKSKGFGFVTFASNDEAEKAVSKMNGNTLDGRAIFVAYAKPKTSYGGGIPIARGPPDTISDRVRVNFFDEEPNTHKSETTE